jgi:hypothetical protein
MTNIVEMRPGIRRLRPAERRPRHPLPVDCFDRTRILSTVYQIWPARPFDASSISWAAPENEELLAAVGLIGCGLTKSGRRPKPKPPQTAS